MPLGRYLFKQGVDVCVRLPVVHDDGLVQFQRQPNLGFKQRQLGVLRHRPVVVQPALAYRYHLGVIVVGHQRPHLSGPVAAVHRHRGRGAFLAAVGGGQQAFRVDANGRHHPWIAVRQFQHPGRIPRVGGLLAHAYHALVGQAVQQRKAVGIKGAGTVMGVGVKNRSGHTFSLFGGGFVHQPDAHAHEHQRRQILPAEQRFSVEHGTEQHVDHRVDETKDGDTADRVNFSSAAPTGYSLRRR